MVAELIQRVGGEVKSSSSNNFYVKMMGTSIVSLLENTRKKVTIHILHSQNFTLDDRNVINHIVANYHQHVKFYNMDELVPEAVEKIRTSVVETGAASWPVNVMYTAIAHLVLPKDVHKIIHLGTDTIINLDISEAYKIDLSNYPLAAVPEYDSKYGDDPKNPCGMFTLVTNRIVEPQNYFNADFMFFNMDYFRRSKKVIDGNFNFYVENKCEFGDQDIFNYWFADNFMNLPIKYNRMVVIERFYKFENVVGKNVYHFVSTKPDLNTEDIYNKMYLEYFAKTPWFNSEIFSKMYKGFQNVYSQLYTQDQISMIQLSALLTQRHRIFFVEHDKY